ncbi:Wzz/FepE/Etk N-terminal domain-containing protein [Halobacillus sp. HZG1]|uniref:YveK family protein n=1 Tax=Halobacillus sp. HZG1 TaxID=3111769 RepID=UPI002DBDFF2B|nr:Wzz/FepE/Etk N-terminal domain-containing protein [Halobacillus sp. HZG1]MEC3883973.1 Wzz/FepE/Etk N-terminal domain-containing protein [Halobacillus sp. HZG1]
MQDQMDIKTFFTILKKRVISILLVTFFVFILVGAVSIFVMKPTFESMESIVVGDLNKQSTEYGESRELNMLLASTIDFIKSPIVLNLVRNEFGMSYEDLEKQVVVQNTKDSQIVNVVVRGSNAKETEKIANMIVATTVDKMNDLFDVNDIYVLSDSPNQTSTEKVGSTTLNLGIGLIVGLLAGIGTAFLREHLDDSIRNVTQIEKELGITVLGDVHLKKKNSRRHLRNDLPIQTDKQMEVVEGEKNNEVSV